MADFMLAIVAMNYSCMSEFWKKKLDFFPNSEINVIVVSSNKIRYKLFFFIHFHFKREYYANVHKKKKLIRWSC